MLQKIGHIVTTERLSGIHHLLAGEVRFFEKYAKLLHLKAKKCLVKCRKDIINQEFQLERISNMIIDLYAIAIVLSRLNSDLKKRKPDQVERQLVIGKTFCDEALKRIRRNDKQIDVNIDPLTKQIAKGDCAADGYSLGLFF